MKPKQIVVIYSGAREWGGIETYLTNLFTFVSDKEVVISLYSMGEWPLTGSVRGNGGRVVVFPEGRISFATIKKMKNQLKADGANLIVSQGVVANVYGRLLSIISGIPNLTTVHSNINYDYSRPVVRFIYRLSDSLLAPVTKQYIAVSRHLKKTAHKDSAEVIYNGINAEITKLPKHKSEENLVVGSVGRFHSVKNFENLVRAVQMLPDIKLIIWGHGDSSPLQALAKKLGVSNRVSFPGTYKSESEVFPKIDIYCQPSISEGFGLVVAEATICGIPVVVSPGGSLPEVAAFGSAVVCRGFSAADIANGLKSMSSDYQSYRTAAEKLAPAAANEFSVTKWASKTKEVYLRACK